MYHMEGGQGKPSKKITLNGSQSTRDQWPPIPLPSAWRTGAALALHSTVYLNTWRHPRGGGIAPDPLKLISSQASERGNCLMKMDHGDGFTFHFVTAGIRLYYSQPSPLSSPSHTTHSGRSVYSLCILDLVPFFWKGICMRLCIRLLNVKISPRRKKPRLAG